ncbi:ABC transporter substrate-binding protein [Inquilinus sp. CAU 1745]|uniref:ABC transporter substrate-binding protein n=1 Tax=Inquilinus sp. CAU 1745 TaxID=3140369 RepID=UPI00325AA9B9
MNSVRLGALAGAAAIALGIATPVAAEPVSVYVTAIVEHPALDAARDGVRDELEEQGFELDFEYQSAQGNPATAAQIARQFVGEGPDVIVPISTPSAQAVVAATQDIPVVFTAVTDPVGAQLVEDLDAPGGNVTGVSDLSPLEDHLKLIREIMPEAEGLGVPYNPGEANAVTLVSILSEIAPTYGFNIVEAPAPRTADVLGAAQSLIGKVDAIYVPTDNTIVSALEAVLSVGADSDIPVFSGDTDSVERGAIATVGFDYYQVGRQTGEVVARVLNGEDPGTIPVRNASGTDLFVNPAAAESMGIELSQELIDRAHTVVGQ